MKYKIAVGAQDFAFDDQVRFMDFVGIDVGKDLLVEEDDALAIKVFGDFRQKKFYELNKKRGYQLFEKTVVGDHSHCNYILPFWKRIRPEAKRFRVRMQCDLINKTQRLSSLAKTRLCFHALPHIEDDRAEGRVRNHREGAPPETLLVKIRKISAGLRAILIDSAQIVFAQKRTGRRLEMFSPIGGDSHVFARELRDRLFESTGKTHYVLIVHDDFQPPTTVAAGFAINLTPDLVRSLFRQRIHLDIR